MGALALRQVKNFGTADAMEAADKFMKVREMSRLGDCVEVVAWGGGVSRCLTTSSKARRCNGHSRRSWRIVSRAKPLAAELASRSRLLYKDMLPCYDSYSGQ